MLLAVISISATYHGSIMQDACTVATEMATERDYMARLSPRPRSIR